MKTAFLYSFLAVLSTFVLNLLFYLVLGNEMAKTATLVLNIVLVAGFTFVYYATPNPSTQFFVLFFILNSFLLTAVIAGGLAHQGLAFLSSIYFWGQLVERIAIPLLYSKFILRKP